MPASGTTTLQLDPQIRARIERLVDSRQLSADGLMREAMEQYLSREEARERMRQDAVAAWTEYQLTGLYATAAEADAWLAWLEAGGNRPC